MCNCNNTYQTTICQPQIPCDQTDCSCPVKDLSTDCILYTGDTLECSGIEGQTILTELIQQLDAYICTALSQANSSINLINVGTGVQIYKGVDVLGKREIRSLKTTNPIITIGLAGESKEIAFGIDEDELTSFITNNTTPGLEGVGTFNYVSKWTPNGTMLGDSQIQDNGTSISVNTTLSPVTKVLISSGLESGLRVLNSNGGYALNGVSTGLSSISNISCGVSGSGSGGTVNYGGEFGATGTAIRNSGLISSAIGATINIGAQLYASGGTNYALQLQDGTEGIGKFLTNVTADGKANWANIVVGDIKSGTSTLGQVITSDGAGNSTWTTPTSSGLSGSGINNYVARWHPNGTTLTTGIIQDNNASIGINTAPDASVVMYLRTSGNETNGVFSINDSTSPTNKNAIYGFTSGINTTAENRGVEGVAQDSTLLNVGVVGVANSGTGGAVGGSFSAQGPGTKYAVKLRDNTEGIGKILTCMTVNGEANWADPVIPNLQKVITATYVLTDADNGYTIFINNNTTPISISLGTITIANFCVGFIQEGSADVTFVGVTNPIGLKSKGQGYQTFIERKLSTATYYLLGNTKA